VTWKLRLRRVEAAGLALSLALVPLWARGAESEGGGSSHGPGDAPSPSSCPDADAVWTHVVELVPSAARQLAPTRRNLEIVDDGASYRVRVSTPQGVVERIYFDPLRACEKRARFAAEFVVVALMPPTLAAGPAPTAPVSNERSGPPAPTTGPPLPALVQPPAPQLAATSIAPEHVGARTPRAHGPVQLELSALASGAPPIAGPGVFEWGGELRTRFGTGRLAAIAAVEVAPKQPFEASRFRGVLERVPAVAGVRLRATERPLEVDADLGLVLAVEHYEGVGAKIPGDATRVTPGLEAAVDASSARLGAVAPLLGLRCAWLPITQDLAAPPQALGKTPSLWLEVALGILFEP
jgi:hypothetical protein